MWLLQISRTTLCSSQSRPVSGEVSDFDNTLKRARLKLGRQGSSLEGPWLTHRALVPLWLDRHGRGVLEPEAQWNLHIKRESKEYAGP